MTSDHELSVARERPLPEGPVFVVGLGRSGTTLMQRQLNRHPVLAVAPETHFLHRWVRGYRKLDWSDGAAVDAFLRALTAHRSWTGLGLDPDAFVTAVRARGDLGFRAVFDCMLQMYAESQGKLVRGEKTPVHHLYIDTLFEWFPQARIVYIVRDPRAVVTSYATLDQPWAQGPVEEYAFRWRRSARIAESLRGDPRVILVQYEGFVERPSAELDRVFEFVGLDPLGAEAEMEEPKVLPSGALEPSGPVSTKHRERWRSVLTAPQLHAIETITRSEMMAFGYAPAFDAPSTRQRLAVHARRAGQVAVSGGRRRAVNLMARLRRLYRR